MKAYLSRRYKLSASHRLHSDAYSPDENRAIYGKCNNPHGHGHNYVVEITVSGPVDQQTGMVCNLADMDTFVQRAVVQRFDHQDLNHDPDFEKLVPTTENLCMKIHAIVKEGFPYAMLERVRVEETSNNFFEYSEQTSHIFP
ncbi:MAG TPA: 6-carboxytetrahydropterin synthase [Acidobacteriaceae bacterium]|jgi:6-pyruvoyltetrahydropterin/6-carboxytetrahydropterin synthase|nr:6-carboxytetrahydropterin synthase [Acidobacteriaceae bacterium]